MHTVINILPTPSGRGFRLKNYIKILENFLSPYIPVDGWAGLKSKGFATRYDKKGNFMVFKYEVNPISVNHYWTMRCSENRVVVVKGKKAKEYKEYIKWKTFEQCKKNKIKPLFPLFSRKIPVKLSIEYFYKERGKDIDNILKALLDALEGILFENDAQIVELNVKKKKGEKNFLNITIGYTN
jgi:Holliday junction resolvase RusA-like endonuclease